MNLPRGIIGKVKLQVECYSGSKADERPARFHLGERICIVDEVVDQWYGTDHSFFKVLADDSNLYILRQDLSTPERAWNLESFRALKE